MGTWGGKQEGAGRPKGATNKSTSQFKEALNKMLEECSPEIIGWLRDIAADDKSKALEHVARLAEYCHPKLARSETHLSGGVTVTHEEQLTILENLAVSTSIPNDKLIQ